MSLYSTEEICRDCYNACFHKCCGNFCCCKIDKLGEIDYRQGECKYKVIK